jgi:antitoxin CptB
VISAKSGYRISGRTGVSQLVSIKESFAGLRASYARLRPQTIADARPSLDIQPRRWHDLLQQLHPLSATRKSMTEELTKQRKRLRFRSWHRGMKELDLLLGSFSDQYLERFDTGQLARFEALLEVPEPALYAWLVSRTAPPAELRDDVMELLLEFRYRPPAR